MNEQEKEEAAVRSKDRLRASSLQVRNKGGEDDKWNKIQMCFMWGYLWKP